MGSGRETEISAQIIAVVLDVLESDGYDAVQLRLIARRAHVSLATVYKLFPTRDELIVSAVERWMADNTYKEMTPLPADVTVRDGLTMVLRTVFEPWERNPRMLEAYHRARLGPGGQRLDTQGFNAVLPVALGLLSDLDPVYAEDVALIMTNMTLALIGAFAIGSIEITDILPTLERTIHRLTADNESAALGRKSPAHHGEHT
ncbi:TetR family transcriptional regulator [Nocardia cyriacigeorgica]|uniref:TetR family transcriptional regulator n=1 Tax=Nocardia cyriacigeorgica TaxID=135487 RepID=UPI002B4B0250|nr:TetR family transcriptional regulator [Nocardia cyriacigeorgica]